MSSRDIPARTEVTCDRCHNEVADGQGGARFTGAKSNILGGAIRIPTQFDLCISCLRGLVRWFEDGVVEDGVAEDSE